MGSDSPAKSLETTKANEIAPPGRGQKERRRAMAEAGLSVRVERDGNWQDLDVTQMTKEEILDWVRIGQKIIPTYDIECIIALVKIIREQVHPL